MQNYVENMRCLLFLFYTRKALFGQIWSKNQNYQFKLKFGTKTTLNMRNSMMIFLFLTIDIFPGQSLSKNSELFVQS